MPTAVVPTKRMARQKRLARIEDALHVLGEVALLIPCFIRFTNVKKRRRRQLAAVTRHHELSAAIDAVDSVLGWHLRSLIENDEIELVIRREEMADCEWAHHQTRLHFRKELRDRSQQLAHRHVSPFFCRLVPEKCDL